MARPEAHVRAGLALESRPGLACGAIAIPHPTLRGHPPLMSTLMTSEMLADAARLPVSPLPHPPPRTPGSPRGKPLTLESNKDVSACLHPGRASKGTPL